MKILFLSNVPSPYRIDFFNELGKYCDLTVLFEKKISSIRDKSWLNYKISNFKAIFLKGISIRSASSFCPSVTKYLSNDYDNIVCTTFTTLTGMYAISYMRKHNIQYYLEADGGFAKNGKGIKEKIKKHFISNAIGYFSTGKSCDEYFLAYGAEEKKIYRYPFSSVKENDILKSSIGKEEKQSIKNKLGITEKQIVLTVGQFIHRKGFDILLKSIKGLNKNIGFYFVGGNPTKEYLNIVKEDKLDNVHFVGYKSKNELSDYYKASDLFVLPTREDIWGLVIEEAMSYGLPVISTNKCACAQELIQNGKNGYIVETENIIELTDRINLSLSKDFFKSSLETISNFTIEKMVESHIKVFS